MLCEIISDQLREPKSLNLSLSEHYGRKSELPLDKINEEWATCGRDPASLGNMEASCILIPFIHFIVAFVICRHVWKILQKWLVIVDNPVIILSLRIIIFLIFSPLQIFFLFFKFQNIDHYFFVFFKIRHKIVFKPKIKHCLLWWIFVNFKSFLFFVSGFHIA
jgi:hypothetical protein